MRTSIEILNEKIVPLSKKLEEEFRSTDTNIKRDDRLGREKNSRETQLTD